MAEVVRLELADGIRKKLVAKHRHMQSAVDETGKPITDLLKDPFGGYPHLLRALLREQDPTITPKRCSDLIDEYIDAHEDADDPLSDLGLLIMKALQKYLSIEITPTKDEEDASGERPPQDGSVLPLPSND